MMDHYTHLKIHRLRIAEAEREHRLREAIEMPGIDYAPRRVSLVRIISLIIRRRKRPAAMPNMDYAPRPAAAASAVQCAES